MTAIYWANAVDGGFAAGAYWTGGVAPGSGDDAILDAAGVTPYTVTVSAAATVASIQTAADATLDVSAAFTATAGTGTGANAGVIEAGGNLGLAGSIDNTGSILLGGYLSLGAATLSGGGDVTLSDQAGYRIHGTGLVTNIDNTISGAGTISVHLTNETKGVVDATGANNRLVFATFGGAIVNYGLVETTGAAGMLMDNVTEVTNFGTIAADGSGALTMFQCDITNYGEILVTKGSTLVDYGIGDIDGGTIQVDARGSFICDGVTGGDGAFVYNVAFNNAGLVSIPSYNFLEIEGTITNTGTVALNAAGHQTRLIVNDNLTLQGGGRVTLSDDSENLISGLSSPATFTNLDNTITGAGTIGNAAMTIVNEAKGVVDATGANNVLDLVVGPTFTNAGVIEATGADGMLITGGTIANTWKIKANGAGALTLQQTTITNGVGGQVRILAGAVAVLASAEIDGGVASGPGTLDLGTAPGDGLDTLGPSLRLTVAKVALAGASVDVTGSLDYAGLWSQTAGTLSVAAGDKIRFSGVGDAFAGTLAGAGTLAFAGGSDTLTGATLAAARAYIYAAAVTLSGTNDITGELTATSPNLTIAAGGATLAGGGALVLTDAATNAIAGAAATATLTNDDRIRGAGDLGGGAMMLVNSAGATIDGDQSVGLTVDTGANAINNAGVIENTGAGGTLLKSALDNAGTLLAAKGELTLEGAVTGTGRVWIAGGTADFASSFSQNVDFRPGSSGTLELAQSQGFAGAITGFSTTGATTLDLGDIGFVSSKEATFVENKAGTGGVLTVTDGTHTARITLVGAYSASTFVASSDLHGGTEVVDPGADAPTHYFIAAAAGFGAPAGGETANDSEALRPPPRFALAVPRPQFA